MGDFEKRLTATVDAVCGKSCSSSWSALWEIEGIEGELVSRVSKVATHAYYTNSLTPKMTETEQWIHGLPKAKVECATLHCFFITVEYSFMLCECMYHCDRFNKQAEQSTSSGFLFAMLFF